MQNPFFMYLVIVLETIVKIMRVVNIAITCILYFCILTFTIFTPVKSAPVPEPVPEYSPVN